MKKCSHGSKIWFYNDLYFANIYFLPGASNPEIAQFIKKQFGMNYDRPMSGDGRCIEFETDSGRWGLLIQTSRNDMSIECLATIAHESLHATNNILRRVGVKIDPGENDEAQTYLHQWIFTRCLERINADYAPCKEQKNTRQGRSRKNK